MMIAHIRKFVVAAVGLTVLFLHRQYGIDLYPAETMMADILIAVVDIAGSAFTAWAVWRVPNEPAGG